MCTFSAKRDTTPLNVENSVVEVSLSIREFAGHRPCSCDVGNITSNFSARIHQNHILIIEYVVISNVVDFQSVLSTSNDWDISGGVTPSSFEFVVEKRAEVFLSLPPLTHSFCECHPRYSSSQVHKSQFCLTLEYP